jgi:hypothetical protein
MQSNSPKFGKDSLSLRFLFLHVSMNDKVN